MASTRDTDKYWSELYDNGRDFSLINSENLSRILACTDVNQPKTCLDVGCGTGQLTRELFHRGYICTGVDVSAGAIKIARSLTTVAQAYLEYVHFDIEQDDIKQLGKQQYSLITCKLVYAFIKDKPAFLGKIRQLLRPNGIFVIITPHIHDVPLERRSIAVNDAEITLISSRFEQIALYQDSGHLNGLTYLIARR